MYLLAGGQTLTQVAREVVESPFLEIFEMQLDTIQHNMFYLTVLHQGMPVLEDVKRAFLG